MPIYLTRIMRDDGVNPFDVVFPLPAFMEPFSLNKVDNALKVL